MQEENLSRSTEKTKNIGGEKSVIFVSEYADNCNFQQVIQEVVEFGQCH